MCAKSKQDVTCHPDCGTFHPVRESGLKKDPISIHVNKVDIPYDIPSDGELRAVVGELRNGRAMGATGLQAEHIKVWLSDVVCKEEEQSDIGLGYKWWVFIKLHGGAYPSR